MITFIHKTLSLPLFFAFVFLLSSCSSTKLIEEWHDPEYKGPALEKIFIIGVIKSDSRRREFEEKFSKLITTKNRKAITSYTLLPDLKKSGNKKDVLAAIEKTGADGVMVVTTHGVYQQNRTTAGSIDYIPGTRHGGMYGYYGMSHSYIYNQGYTVTDTILRVDTKVFNVETEKMIWSGKTKSINPESAKEVIHEYEKLVVRDMERHGIIK